MIRYDHNFPIWLFEYPWVENTDSCHVFTLIPLRLLSNVKCLSITLAPFATAPKVGMKPSSWPEYPIWISGKFLWYSSSTFKCTSFESILRESSWYYFIQNNEWQSFWNKKNFVAELENLFLRECAELALINM